MAALRRFAAPIGILAAVVVFVGVFAALAQASGLIRVVIPALAALAVGAGVFLMLDRTDTEVQSDDYADDARRKVEAVNATLRRAVAAARLVRDPVLRGAVQQAATTVPDLLQRIQRSQPNSLYSSASAFDGHARSLLGMVEQFADIEAHPSYYDDAPRLLADGRAAAERFNAFALDSIRLVNSGEMAEYQANLDTVAPPELPKLEGGPHA